MKMLSVTYSSLILTEITAKQKQLKTVFLLNREIQSSFCTGG